MFFLIWEFSRAAKHDIIICLILVGGTVTMVCPNCGAEIAENEKKCPECGSPLPSPHEKTALIILAVFYLLIIIAGVVLLIRHESLSDPNVNPQPVNEVVAPEATPEVTPAPEATPAPEVTPEPEAAPGPEINGSYLSENTRDMSVGEIAYWKGLHIGLAYVKTGNSFKSASDWHETTVMDINQVVTAFFEVYNPQDKIISLKYSDIGAYADGKEAFGGDTLYAVTCDGITQVDRYALSPYTRAYVICCREVSRNIYGMKYTCGNDISWSITPDCFSPEPFDASLSLLGDIKQPEIASPKPGDVMYNDKYEIIYRGFEFTDYHDSLTGTEHAAVFKFTLNNTGTDNVDYSLVGGKMRCYRNGLLMGKRSGMQDMIDNYKSLTMIDTIYAGNSVDFYIAFNLDEPSGDMYFIYNTGFDFDDILFELQVNNK